MGSILSQEDYFHTSRMPKKAVDLVIETLSTEAMYGSWDYPGNMHTGLIKAKRSLHKDFKVQYSYEKLIGVIDLLKQQFTVWKSLIEDAYVMINMFTKNVLAKPSIWEHLVMNDDRVKWYAYEGEKAYVDLEVIFVNPWKGKDEFIHLGEGSGLHKVPARFDDIEVEPLSVASMLLVGRTYIDDHSPIFPVGNAVQNDETFSPNPVGTPGLRIITKEAYEKSLSGRTSKNAKQLFFAPNSPFPSTGSSNNPIESTFQKLKARFDKCG